MRIGDWISSFGSRYKNAIALTLMLVTYCAVMVGAALAQDPAPTAVPAPGGDTIDVFASTQQLILAALGIITGPLVILTKRLINSIPGKYGAIVAAVIGTVLSVLGQASGVVDSGGGSLPVAAATGLQGGLMAVGAREVVNKLITGGKKLE